MPVEYVLSYKKDEIFTCHSILVNTVGVRTNRKLKSVYCAGDLKRFIIQHTSPQADIGTGSIVDILMNAFTPTVYVYKITYTHVQRKCIENSNSPSLWAFVLKTILENF